ncbi:hypothetical protein [Desulfobacula sp.]|uniref:hypothetical protein n=1 Tax=Desulfobacula sp. TaxID=2593537 RepID=UPI00260388E3|nr:hypothetical protein [Desulfobacula sp.]
MTKQSPWHGPSTYEIEVYGRLDRTWSNWFEGRIVGSENAKTRLSIEISDQSALLGILNRIHNLGLPLISVNRINK